MKENPQFDLIHDRQDEDWEPQRGHVAGHLGLDEFCRLLEKCGPDHSSYYHYSNWEALRSMMTPAKLGEAERRVLWLSRASDMNDKIEKTWGDRVYFACFSYSRYEDVAMWMNYGKKSPEAIRIRFDGRRVRAWYDAHKDDKTGVYSVESHQGKVVYLPILPTDIEEFRLVDVAYVIPSAMTQGWLKGNVEYARQFFIVESREGKSWADAIYDGTGAPNDVKPYFKKRGWGYERETRLIIRLKEGVKAGQHLAVDFEEPYQGFEDDAGMNLKHHHRLMHGPWFDPKSCKAKAIERLHLNLEDLESSDYKDEIAIMSSGGDCATCPYKKAFLPLLNADEVTFVKQTAESIRRMARTINWHIDCRDFRPNPLKINELKGMNFLKLIELSKRDDRIAVYLDRLAEIEASRIDGWRKRIGMVDEWRDN